MEENKESQAQKIVQEDEDLIVSAEEIQRIVMLYLGREPTEEEINRFEGMKESELKILTDYLNEQKDASQNEAKVLGDANKIQGDLANKEMKIQGDNALQQMKQLGAVPPGGQPLPEMATAPVQGQPSPEMATAGMPPQAGMPPEGAMPPRKKFAQDGRFFPVKFS